MSINKHRHDDHATVPTISLSMVLIATLMLTACGGKPEEEIASKKQEEIKPVQVALSSFNVRQFASNEPYKIFTSGKKIICKVATWSAESWQLIKFFQDAAIKEKLSSFRIILVLEDEWPEINSQWISTYPEMTNEEREFRLRRMKVKSGDGPLFDPSFLEAWSGEAYLLTDKIPAKQIPSVLDAEVGRYVEKPLDWLLNYQHLPVQLAQNTWDKYKPSETQLATIE